MDGIDAVSDFGTGIVYGGMLASSRALDGAVKGRILLATTRFPLFLNFSMNPRIV